MLELCWGKWHMVLYYINNTCLLDFIMKFYYLLSYHMRAVKHIQTVSWYGTTYIYVLCFHSIYQDYYAMNFVVSSDVRVHIVWCRILIWWNIFLTSWYIDSWVIWALHEIVRCLVCWFLFDNVLCNRDDNTGDIDITLRLAFYSSVISSNHCFVYLLTAFIGRTRLPCLEAEEKDQKTKKKIYLMYKSNGQKHNYILTFRNWHDFCWKTLCFHTATYQSFLSFCDWDRRERSIPSGQFWQIEWSE